MPLGVLAFRREQDSRTASKNNAAALMCWVIKVSEVTGETNLKALLTSMSPALDDTDWVFAVVGEEDAVRLTPHAIASFREAEGLTLVLPQAAADDLKRVSASMKRIILEVHSSLEAVGLTAAVASALAEEGISANVVAAYYHDHIFVPKASADRALAVLQALTTSPD